MHPGLLLLVSWAAQADPAAPPVQVAVTRSGARVQCIAPTAPGDRVIHTPYGRLSGPSDPVEAVIDAVAQRDRLRSLRTASDSGFDSWLHETLASGLLDELVEGIGAALESHPERLDLYQALESWGARLDRAPEKLALDQRVDWLWEQLQKEDPAAAVMLSGQLHEEVARTEQADFSRRVSLGELRRALRSDAIHLRRIAARVGGRQADFQFFEPLLKASVWDGAHAVREAAAAGAAAIHAYDARQYWTVVLARSREPQRIAAADALGRHGGQDAIHVLTHVLSAHDRTNPVRYEFAGREIQTVRDSLEVDFSGRYGRGDEGVDELQSGSVFKVTLLSNPVTIAVLDALAECCPDGPPDHDASAWLDWYLENVRPGQG